MRFGWEWMHLHDRHRRLVCGLHGSMVQRKRSANHDGDSFPMEIFLKNGLISFIQSLHVADRKLLYIIYIYKHLKFETFHTIVKITRSDFFGVVRQRPHQKPHLKNVGFFGKGPGLNPGSPGLSRCIICMHWYMKDLSLFLLIYNNYTSNLSAF